MTEHEQLQEMLDKHIAKGWSIAWLKIWWAGVSTTYRILRGHEPPDLDWSAVYDGDFNDI